ncbi:hypothetical protein N1851_003886 [Merluccius polli]|uniref:Uncharacterized protein n=1 Tax=Merluccius polli TaxID=89951 RepID=A0AA47PB73_MERPO|nr:hypothetical protein N1851_003886 [Merluccius polli]
MASHYCRICSASMSASDGHRECPMGERQRRAALICGHVQKGRRERRRSPVQPLPSSGHGRKWSHKRGRQRESPHRPSQRDAPTPAKRPAEHPAERPAERLATAAVTEGGGAESLQILSALQALAQKMDRLVGRRGSSPDTRPPGQEDALSSGPVSRGEERSDADVLSLYGRHTGDDLMGDLQTGSAELGDDSMRAEEVPVSSLMTRVLSAANILGLEAPTPAPAPVGGIWEGIPCASPLPPVPVPPDYTAMLRSSWGKLMQRPQFNAGCRQLATATYPVETGLGDMPPVEPSMAALTSLGLTGVSPNPRCPRKECAKTDRLATRTFNAAARAARMGNALAITLASLRKTLSRDDQDARALLDAALSSHAQLTRDVGDAMGSAVLCRRQVWLAQTALPEPIKQELLNLPVAPGHVFHPGSQEVLDRAERAAASREAVQRVCRRPASVVSGVAVGRYRPRLPARPPLRGNTPQASGVEGVNSGAQAGVRAASELDQGKAASTVKVYASAISAFHQGVDNGPLGRHPLVCQFLKGARRLRPGRTLRAPGWDLPTVLTSLTVGPYEPILNADLRSLSLKTAFLLALCSAKRVSELCALSISDDCLRWQAGGASVSLWPNPAFLPKVLTPQSINQVLEVTQFQPSSTSQAEQDKLLTLCPVRALKAYLARTQSLRKAHSQLFICYGAARQGLPLSKQRLSHWLVEGAGNTGSFWYEGSLYQEYGYVLGCP